ncbi:MAG: PilW family protein [Desulforhopalus sp.]|nr:PilW family protein [Desulforhopalus sp.]
MRRATSHIFKSISENKGFTLVELIITMGISLFVMGVVYTAYAAYQRQYSSQTQVVEMQQNIRSAINFMMDDIRMAGYDPVGSNNAGIISATATALHITKDTTDTLGGADDGDGLLDGPNENVTFGFPAGVDVAPADGVADSGAAPLAMIVGVTPRSIAENIHAMEFNYTLDDGTKTTAPGTPDDIRSVTISILARVGDRDPGYTDAVVYTTDSGVAWGPFNDNFRRRLLTATVKCRNMGI